MLKDLDMIPYGDDMTYVTDGARAFDVIASEMNVRHMNCIHHFLNNEVCSKFVRCRWDEEALKNTGYNCMLLPNGNTV